MNLPLLAILCYVALADLTQNRIPNGAVLLLLGLGLVQQLPYWMLDSPGLTDALLGLGVGLLLTLPFYFAGVLGAGDAKLLAACGLVLGIGGLLLIQLLSLIFIGFFALLWFICRGQLMAQLKIWYCCGFSLKGQSGVMQAGSLPFGGAIFLAALAQQLYF